MVKIQRRVSIKKYLRGKNTYAYDRLLLEVPRRYRETVIPFAKDDFQVEVTLQEGYLRITFTSCKR